MTSQRVSNTLLTPYSSNMLQHKGLVTRAVLWLLSRSLTSPFALAQTDATELDEVVVQEVGEPEAKLPLGTRFSGKTLRSTPGSGGDPLRTLQTLPGLIYTDDQEALPAVRRSRPGDNYFQADFAPVDYLFHLGGVFDV